jgi:hypothetical protein
MKKFGSILLAAIFLCAGCAYSVETDLIAPARIVGGYNPFWGDACPGEPVADGEKFATFTFTLDEAGKAQNATLVEKTNDCLAEAARAELEKWVFAPPEYHGRPIENAIYTLNFIYSGKDVVVVVKINDATGEIENLEIRREE